MDRPRIYISGPITIGNRDHNLRQSFLAQQELISLGCSPLNPMLTMLVPFAWDVPHNDWIEVDLKWVAVSEAVLRLPGESKGADAECQYAIGHDIPVFHDIYQLTQWMVNREEPKWAQS